MIERAIFNNATAWVQSRIPSQMMEGMNPEEISATINALANFPPASATFLVPDMFPGLSLELLYLHDTSTRAVIKTQDADYLRANDQITLTALRAIGTALLSEMKVTGTELVNYQRDNGDEIIVFLPQARSTVLQATGTTILPATD